MISRNKEEYNFLESFKNVECCKLESQKNINLGFVWNSSFRVDLKIGSGFQCYIMFNPGPNFQTLYGINHLTDLTKIKVFLNMGLESFVIRAVLTRFRAFLYTVKYIID